MGSSKVWVLFALMVFGFKGAGAQSQEAQQLLLNVEKLTQLKNILSDMKKGYEVVSKGYSAVKNIAQGNFSLHEVFLDGLWLVSPEVRKYHRIAAILKFQSAIVSEYKAAFRRFSASSVFRPEELDYLGKVYRQLFEQSLDILDQLAMVITAQKMRMSDEERLKAIDRIFLDTQDKLLFLRAFNQQAGLLGLQREREQSEVKGLGDYFKTD